MEQNKELVLDVICGDEKLITESIFSYNNAYNTDFKIIEFIYDEVIFARIRVSKYKISDIFQLGFQFGGLVESKRHKGEIDW